MDVRALVTWRRARRMRRVATFVVILLLSLVPASTVAAQDPGRAVLDVHRMPAYRAGSAAAMFGPATAIADFDADGQPDFAVADRHPGPGDVDYLVDVRLSAGKAQTLRFVSPQNALAVTAIDIDHDHDIDLVFTPIVDHHIVGVWLNDGAGHFERGSPANAPADLERVVALGTRAPLWGALPATPSPKQLYAVAMPRSAIDEPVSSRGRVAADGGERDDARTLPPDSPRGPPDNTALL